ncbi:restriction endonuclease subunit S [Intestinimonas butyriciproducens]|uniref:restriction endonuclease subunit S n=1 Tax=Intestinimonas butyriciproducens TaxID=1297617 RepID=UPI00051BF3E8|nr:restriction endonuclease subunit S [Intestinimonas butyriciproducens]
MTKKKNVPQVRFAGYSDEWVKYQFGDILDKYEDPIATPHDGYERLGVRSHVKGTFHSYVAPGSELETAQMHRVAAGKLLFSITFAWEHAVAITDEADAGKLVSHRFPQFTFAPEMDPKFFRYVVADEKFRYHLWLSSPGGAGRNRVLNIPEMMEYQTYLPEKPEQTRLADWFSHLDDLLKQHQTKLEKLQNFKSSMLEKMFPKDGAGEPEVRFKEYLGSWEKHKVGDFLTESHIIGHTGLTAKKLTVKLWGKGVVEKSDAYGGSIHTQYYVRKAGQFMYGKLDFLHAAFGIVPENLDGYESTLDSPAFDLSGIDGQFLMNTVIQENFYLKNGIIANGSRKAKRIHVDTFLEMDILTPSIEEQIKIGNYFTQLDKRISFAQIEIDKIQNIKKALLEKMFV